MTQHKKVRLLAGFALATAVLGPLAGSAQASGPAAAPAAPAVVRAAAGVVDPQGCPVAPDCQGQNAPYTFTSRDVLINVPDPDMFGATVQLDARVLTPVGTGPFAGLLINHGYLGNKTGDGDTAEAAAAKGFIVLRYSSRGFGNTKGQVDLVGPKEINDMLTAIHWLNNPSNGPIWVNHIGHYGGSYGGAHDLQLGVANDPAVRALIPAATWFDLYQGLVPNDVLKVTYLSGFYAAGRLRTDGYNNYDPEIDAAYAASLTGALGVVKGTTQAHSTFNKLSQIRTPTFIVQGLNDGLFDGNQAIRAYQALAAQGTPVRMYLGGIGHPPARAGGGNEIAHVGVEVQAWLDHYVRQVDNGIERAAPIEFGTAQWDSNPDFAAGDAGVIARTKAARAYPFGGNTALQLCGVSPGFGTLQSGACPGALPTLLAAGSGGDPTSEPVAGKAIKNAFQDTFKMPFPDAATPVDVVKFDGPVLTAPASYAGIPTLKLSVASNPANASAPGVTAPPNGAAAYQVDPKIYDVSPNGSKILVTRGAYAEQFGAAPPGVHTATFDAFAFAYTFPAGHHIQLSLSSADVAYLRPNTTAFQVAVLPGSTLNLLGTEGATGIQFGLPGATDPVPAAVVPEVPLPALLPVAALGLLGLMVLRRRRTV